MTSRELFNRIRWDHRIDQSLVRVGYRDRFQGVLEMDFDDLRVGQDVPWHRIVHFRYEQQIVWSREGVDKVELMLGGRAGAVVQGGAYRWGPDSQSWRLTNEGTELPAGHSLRLLTHNLLCDLYDGRVPSLESRATQLWAELKSAEADLIVLQEVTPRSARLLLSQEWVRTGYYSSAAPDSEGLSPSGQLILSRWWGRFQHSELQSGKRVTLGRLTEMQLAAVHLSSDLNADAQELRGRQLDEIVSKLDPQVCTCLVGDFNQDGPLELPGFVDLWSQLRPGLAGYTYHPGANPLASLTSTRGLPARFDRVLLRGTWTGLDIKLRRPPEPASDHFALLCELAPPLPRQPVHQSALVIIPPADLWPGIQAIRREHDKSFARWMPHINLLYGFVPRQDFEAAAQLISARVHSLGPFRVRLSELRRFEHRRSTTIWLHPHCEPPGALHQLQALLQECFPLCREQSGHSAAGYTPHLTVANFPEGARAPELPWRPQEFEVERLCLIARQGEQPFTIQRTVTLGEGKLDALVPAPVDRTELVQKLKGLVKRAGAQAHLVGSAGLNLGLPWADLDFACLGELSSKELFKKLPEGRTLSSPVPLLKCEVEGVSVDFQHSPAALNELRALTDVVDPEKLRALLRPLRTWTHHRCLDKSSLGFPGGWSWALIAAWALREGAESLTDVFEQLADWEGQSLSVSSAAVERFERQPRDLFPVLTCAVPTFNSARNLVPATLRVLQEEFRRAHELATRCRWRSLLEPFQSCSGMTLSFPAGPSPLQSKGWVEGNIVGFLLAIERLDRVPLRPYSLHGDSTSVRVWIDCCRPLSESLLREMQRNYQNWSDSDQLMTWQFESDC